MERHRVTGHWRRGAALALVTVVMWGALPIALKVLIQGLDAFTITWARFVVSTLLLGGILAAFRQLPDWRALNRGRIVAVILAALGLLGNYVLYIVGLQWITPGTAQVVIQLAHAFVIAGAMLLYGERFSRLQWTGVATLALGLALFFNNRIADLFSNLGNYGLGVVIIVIAAFVWAVYALAQKNLLRAYSSQGILLMVYIISAGLLWPVATPSVIPTLSPLLLGLLAFSCLNTLLAYGCYSEACQHMEASRVSALLATIPLVTLGMSHIAANVWPEVIAPERINALSVLGATLVVIGSALAALGKSTRFGGGTQPDVPEGE